MTSNSCHIYSCLTVQRPILNSLTDQSLMLSQHSNKTTDVDGGISKTRGVPAIFIHGGVRMKGQI